MKRMVATCHIRSRRRSRVRVSSFSAHGGPDTTSHVELFGRAGVSTCREPSIADVSSIMVTIPWGTGPTALGRMLCNLGARCKECCSGDEWGDFVCESPACDAVVDRLVEDSESGDTGLGSD